MPPPTILSIVGVRPQFIKHAPLSRALRPRFREIVIHTGQHYDDRMSRLFFEELEIPAPDRHLGVGSGSHARQTAAVMERVEAAVEELSPDCVLVFGDTNTTLGAALAVAKLSVPLGHVEAGVRTLVPGNPEELNRILVDHASDELFVPTPAGVAHLEREHVRGQVHLVGDVMRDALDHFLGVAERRADPLATHTLVPGGYVLATVHRAENTDDPRALAGIVGALEIIEEPVLLPLHPRTRVALERHGLLGKLERASRVRVVEPAGYLDMLLLERHARLILTDSGGVQKEAYMLGVPCVTIFPRSPWIETVEDGWNLLVEPVAERIAGAVVGFRPSGPRREEYGGGHASTRIADILAARLGGG